MTAVEPQPTVPPPSPLFQFSLRTLLLLFVVLGSSMAVFGAWGIVVFLVVVVLGIYCCKTSVVLSRTHVILLRYACYVWPDGCLGCSGLFNAVLAREFAVTSD